MTDDTTTTYLPHREAAPATHPTPDFAFVQLALGVRDDLTFAYGCRLLCEIDKKDPLGRIYYQIECDRADSYTGEMGTGRGGKAYLSDTMTESELVRLAYGLMARYIEHEGREGFEYKGKKVFGPHLDINALLEIADRTDFRKPLET